MFYEEMPADDVPFLDALKNCLEIIIFALKVFWNHTKNIRICSQLWYVSLYKLFKSGECNNRSRKKRLSATHSKNNLMPNF